MRGLCTLFELFGTQKSRDELFGFNFQSVLDSAMLHNYFTVKYSESNEVFAYLLIYFLLVISLFTIVCGCS